MRFLSVCDPNWSADAGGGGRGAGEHYALSGVDAIAQSMRLSRAWRETGPGLLWMWATTSALVTGDAHTLAGQLGFRICAGFVWAKIDPVRGVVDSNDNPAELFTAPARLGLGQWSRVEHEHLLLCRRGDVKVPAPASRQRSVIYAPRGKHSAKPEEAWRVIESTSQAVLGVGIIGVEFHSRLKRPGWISVGRLDGEDGPIVERGETCADKS